MNENVRYCRDLVRRVRWTEYVGSLLLPENVRPLHWGLIALNYELFRIRYMGQERTTNQSRPAISDAVRMGKLNFWIDTLLNTKSTGDLANPVVDVIKRSSIGIIQNYEILMEALLNAHVNNLTNKTAISLRSYYEDNSLVDIHAAPLKMVLDAMHSDIRVDLTGLAGSLGLVNVLKYAVPLISCNIDPGIPRELLIEHNKNIFDLREWSHDSTRLLFRAISDIATMRLSFVPQDPPNSSYRSQYLVQHKVTDPLELNKQKIILYPYYLMAMRQLDRVQKNRYDLMKASLSTWQDGWYPLVLFRWYLKNIRVQI